MRPQHACESCCCVSDLRSSLASIDGSSRCRSDARRYELGRIAGNTKLNANVTVRRIRVRGGAFKFRALRLDSGNFAWPSQAVTRKTRLLEVTYNASNNELVSLGACAARRRFWAA